MTSSQSVSMHDFWTMATYPLASESVASEIPVIVRDKRERDKEMMMSSLKRELKRIMQTKLSKCHRYPWCPIRSTRVACTRIHQPCPIRIDPQ